MTTEAIGIGMVTMRSAGRSRLMSCPRWSSTRTSSAVAIWTSDRANTRAVGDNRLRLTATSGTDRHREGCPAELDRTAPPAHPGRCFRADLHAHADFRQTGLRFAGTCARDGRSPGLRVAAEVGLPGFPVARSTFGSPLTVAGAAPDWHRVPF